MTWSNPSIDYSMPRLASLFDAMSGVKKLSNLMQAITSQTSANEALFEQAKSSFRSLRLIEVVHVVTTLVLVFPEDGKQPRYRLRTCQDLSLSEHLSNY